MSTQTIKTSFQQAGGLTAPKISVVMDSQVRAANAQPVRITGTRSFLATVPAFAILVASGWAVGNEGAAGILQALLWASGFLLLVFAIGSHETGFGELLFSGLALLLVALISATIAIEFAVVGAAMLAAWISTAIIRF